MAKCLFVDQIKGNRQRPCKKCSAMEGPLDGECYETSSHFEWWAAEMKDGKAVFFRCFPKARKLPKTPQARALYVRTEYRNALKDARAKVNNQFRDRKKRGIVWNIPSTNSLFARIISSEKDIKKFRPACACEVAAWLAGHKSDFFAMKNGEEIIERLESFV